MKDLIRLLAAAGCAAGLLSPARATYLFSDWGDMVFPEPGFLDNANHVEYNAWDIFSAPHTLPNYPDYFGMFGGTYDETQGAWVPVRRSTVPGFPANDSVYNPDDSLAFWDTRNPTITQTKTNTAFIVSPDGTGNIYSWQSSTGYKLSDSTADASTPYDASAVLFYFQTDGTLVDFSSIKLKYTDGSGEHMLAPTEYLREFLGSDSADASAANAFTNRVGVQWDLTGLNVDTYEIVWDSKSSSMSFQKAALYTADVYGNGLPESRTWTAATGNWSAGANWAESSSSQENGNVRFGNTSTATVNLDGNKTVGEMIFQSAADVTINRTGSQKITSNTGITTTAGATGDYVINADWVFGATNLFEINAGSVRINGVVSGSYGMLKQGDGTLVLGGNNTFTGGVTLWGGTMRMEGANKYAGGTAILTGRMEIAAESPLGADGALGRATSDVILGADADNFSVVGGGPAALFIDGDHTVGQSIALAAGGFEKRIGAMNTSFGATYSGTIYFSGGGFGGPDQSATNVKFTAQSASDRMVFTGAMTGGKTTDTLTIDGAGTVVLGGGTAKSFGSATTIASGTLEIASGTTFTGAGAWTVNSGARLRVNGSYAGTGTLALNGGTLTGSGTVSKSLTFDAGDRLAPGVGVGQIALEGVQTWGAGGGYEWQLGDAGGVAGSGWDFAQITGTLAITATVANPFTIYVSSLDLEGFDGLLDYDWLIATASEGITGFAEGKFVVDASGFSEAGVGTFSVERDGNSLLVVYTVPEPGTWMLILGGAAALGLWSRRSRSRVSIDRSSC